jgi:malonyl-CoA O-methyltransferase
LIDLHDIGDFCISAGFVSPIVASNRVSFKYKKAETALKELRMLSGNPCSNRDIFLRGKNWYKTIINALNNCRDSSGYVTLEFELIYGHAWKANGVDKKISENKAKGSSKIIEKEIKFK